MPVADILAKVVQGAAGAAGDTDAQTQVGQWQQQRQQQRQYQQKMALAPLSEALQADQTRLALFANPDDPSKPLAGKEDQYNATIERMRQTIGQMRGIVGEKPGGANPVEAGMGNLLDKLHITNHLKNHVAKVRGENAKKYADQTTAQAGAYAAGAPINPYTQESSQLQQAGFTPEQRQAALEHKAGITPKLTSDGIPYKGTDGKYYQNFKDASGQIVSREMPPNYSGPSTVDTRARDDYEQFKKDHPTYKGSFEEWKKNPSGEAKLGTPRVGTSGGKNVYALLTDKGWVDAGTREPLKDFHPLPTFAQSGLYGIDMMQNADGTIGSALLNRRTGQFKPITSSGGAPIAPQIFAQVSKSIEPAVESDTRFRVMKDNEKDALNGNQQAMLSLVANHMGMTLGQQKGTRVNQAQWNEAIASAPWIEAQAAKWFHTDENGDHIFDGFKSGVTITGDQIKQMVGLAQQRRLRQWQQAQQAGQLYGVNVPIPDDLDTPSTTLEGPKTKALKTKAGGGKAQRIRVKLSDGRTGTIDAGDFDSKTMTKVQ